VVNTMVVPASFILRKKAQRDNIAIPDSVTCFIAEKVHSNIRELEGALNRVLAYSQFTGKPISDASAHEALKNFIRESEKKITINLIQKRVAEHFKIKTSDMSAQRRTKNIVLPRQVAMFLARELTDFSLPEIGHQFGGRDHSTVLHACGKIKDLADKDGELHGVLNRLRKELSN